VTPDPVIAISALEHHAYCPRQAALIHVDGVWSDNIHTVHGSAGHRRVDTAPSRQERGRLVVRGLAVYSERLGLSGRCDVVEIDEDGSVEPVEYKIGVRHGRTADIQLCAQAFCLEEMLGCHVLRGHVWYGNPRRRHVIVIDDELRTLTIDAIADLRADLRSTLLPAAVNDERCPRCQLLGHCLPDLTNDPERIVNHVRELFRCES